MFYVPKLLINGIISFYIPHSGAVTKVFYPPNFFRYESTKIFSCQCFVLYSIFVFQFFVCAIIFFQLFTDYYIFYDQFMFICREGWKSCVVDYILGFVVGLLVCVTSLEHVITDYVLTSNQTEIISCQKLSVCKSD